MTALMGDANVGEDKLFKADNHGFGMAGRPLCFELGEPLPRHMLKAFTLGRAAHGDLLLFAVLAWVNAVTEQFTGFGEFEGGILQADFRIHAKGDTFFLACQTILEAPPRAPFGGNSSRMSLAAKIAPVLVSMSLVSS